MPVDVFFRALVFKLDLRIRSSPHVLFVGSRGLGTLVKLYAWMHGTARDFVSEDAYWARILADRIFLAFFLNEGFNPVFVSDFPTTERETGLVAYHKGTETT